MTQEREAPSELLAAVAELRAEASAAVYGSQVKEWAEDTALTSPPAPVGEGWRPIASFFGKGVAQSVIVAVPKKEGGWIVGEAYRRDEGDSEFDGWWWAGTNTAQYYSVPIREINHGDPEWFMPLPAPPSDGGAG